MTAKRSIKLSVYGQSALEYAELGWPVFPAKIEGSKKYSYKSEKFSGTKWGKTRDPAEIDRDFRKFPAKAVGIATGSDSGLFVVEADTEEGHNVDGLSELTALFEKHGGIPETIEALSPSGSRHLYFKHPGNRKIKNRGGETSLLPGVDVRGDGGMVIAPPSVRPESDTPYRWKNPPGEFKTAKAPDWLLDLVEEDPEPPKAKKQRVEYSKDNEARLSEILEGENLHDNTRDLAASWVAGGIPLEIAKEVLRAAVCYGTNPGQRRDDRVEDIDRLILSAKEKFGPGVANADRFKLVPFDQIDLSTKPRYLIKGLIPRPGLTVIWGPPKSGKSFWTLDAMMHVALGRPYRGRRIHRGSVVYCIFEGQHGITARIEAFRQERMKDHDGPPPPFFLVPVSLDLIKEHPDLIAAIQAANADPVAVVLDTLNRSLRGSESSDADMPAYIAAADVIRETFNCAVVVVHHCGHNDSRMRGFSGLPAALDAEISVKKQDAYIRARLALARDEPEGETVWGALDPVVVGKDDDGEAITSCVVIDPAVADFDDTTPQKRKLPEKQQKMLDILVTAEKPLPWDEWRELATSAGLKTQRAGWAWDLRKKLIDKKLVHEAEDGWLPL